MTDDFAAHRGPMEVVSVTSMLLQLGTVPTPLRTVPRSESPSRTIGPQTWATLLILASAVASFVYVGWLTPLTLSPDEAHYWDWSRNLDWSYYSKGPLIAWLIWASCELFGPLSIALTGDLAFAVRFPAVLCHVGILAGWYSLAAGVFRSPWLGVSVVGCAITLPLVRAGAVLMTIDPPFMVCWCWSLVCVWRALETGYLRWWAGAAAFTAVGVLAKYTMALFPAAIVGYLLFHRRSEFRKPGVWLLGLGTLLGWVPVLVWNAEHDWVSFRHVFGQVGVGGGKAGGIFHFVGGQFGMMFGFWLVAFLAAGLRFRPNRETDFGVRLLWWVSVPVWLLFATASFVKSGQPNWPAPAYIGGFVLAVAWVREQLAGPRSRLVAWSLGVSTFVGCLAIVGVHFPTLMRPILAAVAKKPTPTEPYPVRNLDVTARIAGWKELAEKVDEVRARVRAETGQEPVLVGTHWTVPGVLGFYCADHPELYSIGAANRSDRKSQYDVWRPNPVADAQDFQGRTFVIVGDIGVDVANAFERIESPTQVVHAPKGIPVSGWAIWVGHGFRGFDRVLPPPTGSHY